MKKISLVLALALFFLGSIAHAEVFKWVDEKGGVHFTEDPATIPERYREKVENRTTEEDSAGRTTATTGSQQLGFEGQYGRVEGMGKPPEPEYQRFDERKLQAFLNKYCTYQQEVYESRSTAVKHRKGETITQLVPSFREAFMENPNYDERGFSELVERYGTYQSDVYSPGSKTSIQHRKGDIIPERVLSLFKQFTGQYQKPEKRRAVHEEEEKVVKPVSSDDKKSKDYKEPISGDFLPLENPKRSDSGVYNPRTGEYYPPSGRDGYINPRTGEFYPKTRGGAITP
jgi:hypothetical protein